MDKTDSLGQADKQALKDFRVKTWHVDHYNLMDMYKHYKKQYGYYAIDTDPPDPAYCALHKWYNGLSGEVTTVNRLKKLGLIQSDTFRAVELMHPDRVAYKPQKNLFRKYKEKTL